MSPITLQELNSVWNLKKQIERERRRLKDLEVCATSTTILLDGLPHAKPLTGKVERFAAMLADCQQTIDILADQMIQVKFDLLNRLQAQRLSEACERVLIYHYVACLKLSDIAKLMNYTRRYIDKLHCKGLTMLGLNDNTSVC